MLPYWLLFVIITLFVFIDYVRLYLPVYQKNMLFFGLIILMTLFAGLRYNCDNDYETYVHIYNNSPTIMQLLSREASISDVYGEYLFGLITIVLKSLALPKTALFLLMAFLTFFYLYKTTNILSLIPFSALFLYVSMYFLAGGFTQIRFGLATTMSWYGLALLYTGKKQESMIYILLACFFHISAIVIIMVYFAVQFIKLNNWMVYSGVALAAIIATLNLSQKIMGLVSVFAPSVRYESYLDIEAYTEKANQTGIYFYCLVTLLFWVTKKYYFGKNQEVFSFLMKIGLLSLVLGAFFIQMNIISRFGVLLQVVFIFIIPMLCGIQKLRYFLYVPLIAYGALRYAQFFNKETKFIQQYQNVFFK